MTSQKILKFVRNSFVTFAIAFAFGLAIIFAVQGNAGQPAMMSAVNLSMFDSFTAFKHWLASIPYYYYVYIGIGLFAITLTTILIAIFKRGRVKRNDASILVLVGDDDESVDATMLKQHYAVVTMSKTTDMVQITDKCIEPLILINGDSSTIAEIQDKQLGQNSDIDANIENVDSSTYTVEPLIFVDESDEGANQSVLCSVIPVEEELLDDSVTLVSEEEFAFPEDIVGYDPEDIDEYGNLLNYDMHNDSTVINELNNIVVDDEFAVICEYSNKVSDIIDDEEEPIFASSNIDNVDDVNIEEIFVENADSNIDKDVIAEELDIAAADIDTAGANDSNSIEMHSELIVDEDFECIEVNGTPIVEDYVRVDKSDFDTLITMQDFYIIGEEDNEVLFDIDEANEGVVEEPIGAQYYNEVEEVQDIVNSGELIIEQNIADEITDESAAEEFAAVEPFIDNYIADEVILSDNQQNELYDRDVASALAMTATADNVLLFMPNECKSNNDDKAYALVKEQNAIDDAISATAVGTIIVDADGDRVVDEVLVDKDILKLRYKTVDMDKRLQRANEETKAFYSEVKNCLLSYSGVKSRMSKKFDTFTVGRFILAKIAIRGNVINLYLALASERVDEKYFAENVGDSETYGKTPTLHKIKSRRGCKYGLDLIGEISRELNLLADSNYQHTDYVSLYPPENIAEKKLDIAHLFRSNISISDLGDLTDEEAMEYVDIVKNKEYTINKFNPINKYVVFIDDLAELYNSGDTVTISDLIAKEAIPNETNIFLEIRARGVLDKQLNIEAHSFDIQAVKMIILTDGYIIQYK